MEEKKVPTQQEIREKVCEIIANCSGKNTDDVIKNSDDTKVMEAFGCDSLDIVEMELDVEKAFGISLADEELYKVVTIGDMVDAVSKAMLATKESKQCVWKSDWHLSTNAEEAC